ncbi:hypothetical protein RRG08_013559, partial [Elysia crispata]
CTVYSDVLSFALDANILRHSHGACGKPVGRCRCPQDVDVRS